MEGICIPSLLVHSVLLFSYLHQPLLILISLEAENVVLDDCVFYLTVILAHSEYSLGK